MRLSSTRRLATARAALRAATYTPVGFGELLLRLAVVARVARVAQVARVARVARTVDHHPIGGDEEVVQPDIDAHLVVAQGQGLCGHLCTREADVAAVRFSADGDGLVYACQWTLESNGQTPDL
jgi:hypothetical protein